MKYVAYARSSNIYDDSRATKEIQTLIELGYTVYVLGWNRNGDAFEKCIKIFKENNNQVQFYFYNGTTGNGKIGKIISRFRWNKWLNKQLTILKKLDCIHACDFDTGRMVKKFTEKNNIEYVYDIFDYYVDAHPIPNILKNYIEKEEIDVINNARVCIICTEARKEQIKKSVPKKLLIIHNSPEVEYISSEDTKYDYTYCGSLYGGRLLGEILQEYPQHKDLKFAFAGYGEYADNCKRLNDKHEYFSFFNAISYLEVLEIERQSKVVSAIYDPLIRNHRLCAPNKFYEALALGKPLIVCKDTGIDKIVEDNNIGLVIEYDVFDFYNALEKLCASPELCTEMGRRARLLYEREYRWSVMKKRLMSAYLEILD